MSPRAPLSPISRSRIAYAGLVVATVVAGLASRRFADLLPFHNAVRLYAGDVLWAAMVYFVAATIWRHSSILRLAVGSLAFAILVELSQLSRAGWLETARATRVGALVLGFGFLWSDVVCYAAGVALAALVDSRIIGPSVAGSLRRTRSSDIVS